MFWMCTKDSCRNAANEFVVEEEIDIQKEDTLRLSQSTSSSDHTGKRTNAPNMLDDQTRFSLRLMDALSHGEIQAPTKQQRTRRTHSDSVKEFLPDPDDESTEDTRSYSTRDDEGSGTQSQALEAVEPGPVLLTSKSFCSEKNKLAASSTAQAAEVETESTQRPDFNGRWVMTNVEGDMDQFMTDAGVSWALRKMAKGMNYGVGKNFQEISQNGDEFAIVHEQPVLSATTMQFCVGSGSQETIGVDGKPIHCDANWDEQSLVIACKTKAGKAHAPSRRYLQEDRMVIEAKTSKGSIVRRYFTKH